MCEQEQPGDLQLTYADPRNLILPPQYPRTDHQDDPPQTFDHPEHQLIHSVKQFGILQPILARRTPNGLQIISGRRRRTAAIAAGLHRIPVLITASTHDETDDATLNLAENTARKPLNHIDQARAFQRLGPDRSATTLSIDPSIVRRTLRLLELDQDIQRLVAEGQLPPETAHQLHHADPEHRTELAQRAVDKNLQPKDVFRQAPYYTNKIKAERQELKLHAQTIIDTLNELLKQNRARLLMRPAAPKGTIFLDLRSPEETLCFARRLGGETVPDPPATPRKLPRRHRPEDPYQQPRWTATWHDIKRPRGIQAYDFRQLFLPDHAPRYGFPNRPSDIKPLTFPPQPVSHDLTAQTAAPADHHASRLHLPDPRQRLPPPCRHTQHPLDITFQISPPSRRP